MDALTQFISSLTRKPAKGSGFDPYALSGMEPSVGADLGLGAMEGELRDRTFKEAQLRDLGYSNKFKALSEMLGSVQGQRNLPTNPLNMQRDEINNQRALNLDAMNQGFSGGAGQSPIQAREIERRNLEKERMRQPIAVEQMKQSGENFRQGRSIDATQRMVETQMAPANKQADYIGRYYDSLINSGNPGNIKSINRNGVTFQTPQRDPSTIQYDRDLTTARFALGRQDPFLNPRAAAPEIQNFWQAARNRIFNSRELDSVSQSDLLDWLTNPSLQPGLPPQSFEEAFPPPEPGDPRDPGAAITHQQQMAEWQAMRRLALLIKGSL